MPLSNAYDDLVPFVEALVRNGNRLVDGGFILNPDGWRCRLELPIDFALLEASVPIPSNIDLSPDFDAIHDRSTWCIVEGPGAVAARERFLLRDRLDKNHSGNAE